VKQSLDPCYDSRPASGLGLDSKVNILGVGISPVNLAQAVATLEKWREEGRREYVCCTSVHGLVEAEKDPEVRSALNGAGLATEDGMPLVWWCRRAGFPHASRVCGPDLLDAMCQLAVQRGHRHYFYGGSSHVVEQLVSRLTRRYPGLIVAGYRSPPFRPLSLEEDAADVAAINLARLSIFTPGQSRAPPYGCSVAASSGSSASSPNRGGWLPAISSSSRCSCCALPSILQKGLVSTSAHVGWNWTTVLMIAASMNGRSHPPYEG
jgi:hypothetical protein